MGEATNHDERVAIVSDVHGNVTALEEVLSHIKAAGISRIFNLGDLVGKGPRSALVVDRCREVCEVTVQGNWDADVAALKNAHHDIHQWHRAQLGDERLTYLASLPGSVDFMLSGRRVRLFHASQLGPFHRVRPTAKREEHRAMFDNSSFTGAAQRPQIVGYGDLHTAFVLNFEALTLFNAGSVGNPLDIPEACYTVLEGRYGVESPQPWSLRFVRLPYDIEREIAVAEASGMPDFNYYASKLRTALYRGNTPRSL